MKNYLIAERYAKGLSGTLEDNALQESARYLRELGQMYADDHDLRNVLSNPAIASEKRGAVLRALCDLSQVPPSVARLAEVLLGRGRIALLPDVAEVFQHIADERLGRVTARVSTAVALSDAQREALGAQLARYCGKEVRMDCQVDAEVLGGVVARMGSVVLDGSVQSQLHALEKELLSE
jgi:F-type H+-transporting ATPase subunit delta